MEGKTMAEEAAKGGEGGEQLNTTPPTLRRHRPSDPSHTNTMYQFIVGAPTLGYDMTNITATALLPPVEHG
jgi:hypothetical protein